jgi:1-acyl-sn-glycerol-3-phosphate acyltransferase
MGWFYGLSRSFLAACSRTWLRHEVHGAENIPADGPALLVANHSSNLDPPIAVILLRREVHFLAKDELFRVPLLGTAIRHLNAHPVRRGGVDRQALRDCANVLASGGLLLLFPEGTRTCDGALQEGKTGAAMIALQARVPVIPVYIDGTYGAMRRGMWFPRPRKVRVFYGKPFDPAGIIADMPKREGYAVVAAEMMRRVGELMPKALPPPAGNAGE